MNAEFDLNLLRELAAASARSQFVETFARESLGDARIAVDRLEAAGERGAWDEFHDRAHAIKGVTANVGAVRAARCADVAMRRTPAQLPTAWREDCRRLRRALERATDQLENALAALQQG